MLVANGWTDYELLDAGGGEKLERWGRWVLRRPDPQALWPRSGPDDPWEQADARYHRSSSGGGRWEYRHQLPERWTIHYRDLAFHARPTGFKHTGLFPEQAVTWDWITARLAASPPSNAHAALAPKEAMAAGPGRAGARHGEEPPAAGADTAGPQVLNLFGYTGGATVAATAAGATVCHVDAAKGMLSWAKENLALTGLGERPVRLIADDVVKFVKREGRRGRRYDGIVMDPPAYGRGPKGELWRLEDELVGLIRDCAALLSDRPRFFVVNTYLSGLTPVTLHNILRQVLGSRLGGHSAAHELALPISGSGLHLPCGATGRWQPFADDDAPEGERP